MSDAFLTTTSTGGLKPLGSAPQRSYELITGTLRERLSDAHAALFAEPVAAQHGDRFDWYAPVAGKVRRLEDIPTEDQGPIRARLADLVGEIRDLANSYGDAGAAEDGRLGEALSNALEIPSEASIYVVGENPGQPVLVHWAWIEDHHGAVRGVLSAVDKRRQREMAAAQMAPAAAATATVVEREPMSWGWLMWLGWLILALLIAWILFLLTEACGLRGPAWLSFCPGGGPVASASAADALVLRDEVARLEQRLADLDQACQPGPPSPRARLAIDEGTPAPIPLPLPDPVPIPEPSEPETAEAPAVEPDTEPDPDPAAGTVRISELDRRLAEAGADQGALTFSLGWGNKSNLNLEVTCPSGEGGPEACGGTRDVGANDTAATARADPVENVYFPEASNGTYRVRVHLADPNGVEGDHSFELRVRTSDGIRTLRGTVSPSRPEWIYSHVVTG